MHQRQRKVLKLCLQYSRPHSLSASFILQHDFGIRSPRLPANPGRLILK